MRACKSHGISDEHRRLVLRQLPNAIVNGQPTSTAKRLNNSDFETFMATIEQYAGGEIKLRDKNKRITRAYKPGYWDDSAARELDRMRYLVRSIDHQMQNTLEHWGRDGAGLAGWIGRMTNNQTREIDALDYRQVYSLIESLKAYARRQGIDISRSKKMQPAS